MTTLEPAEIRAIRQDDLESLRDAFNSVCAEKWYVATVEGFTLERVSEFVTRFLENHVPAVVAVVGDQIVGWCNILPNTKLGFTHVGVLGMGVRREYRGQGIGRRLMDACLSLVRESGLEKIELDVYTDNEAAIRLYESVGFQREGHKRYARKLEGRYQDIYLMALGF